MSLQRAADEIHLANEQNVCIDQFLLLEVLLCTRRCLNDFLCHSMLQLFSHNGGMYNATLILAVVSNYMHGVLMNIHVLDSITTTKVRQLQYILVLTWRDKCYESCTI